MHYENHTLDDYLLPDAEALDEFSMFDDGVDEVHGEETMQTFEEWPQQ